MKNIVFYRNIKLTIGTIVMVFSEKFLALSMSITLVASLAGCGGSGDSDSKSTVPSVEQPKPIEPTKPIPVKPNPEPQVLEDTSTLPGLPINDNPLDFTPSFVGIDDLKAGIFDIRIGQYNDNNPQGYNCTTEKGSYCTFVKRYKLDEEKNLIVEQHWMYEPTIKQWLSIDNGIPEDLFYNRVFTGDTLNFNGRWGNRNELGSPSYRSNFRVGNGELVFDKGSSKYKVIVEPITLAGGAKRYNINFMLTEGQVIALDDVSFFSGQDESGDNKSYSTLKNYRDSHSSVENLVCIPDLSSGLVFNEKILGATLYAIYSACTYDIDNKVLPIVLEEGVRSISGRKVIYLSNPTDMKLQSSNSTSEQQYHLAIALGSDGVAQIGKAYQPGFGYSLETRLYDRKGVYQYMETTENPEALILPF